MKKKSPLHSSINHPVDTNSTSATKEDSSLAADVASLQAENAQLKEQASRALADYQNLVRRQGENSHKITQLAKAEIFTGLLQPLEHLLLAASSLNDQGLHLVVKQFMQALAAQGLKEYRPLGEDFNPHQMEAIEKIGKGEKVLEVSSPGFLLDGEPLKVAKVKVG